MTLPRPQHKMADYMMDIFGELLYKEPVQDGRRILPSPGSLKGKILIKVSHAAEGAVPLWQRPPASNLPFVLLHTHMPFHPHTLTPSLPLPTPQGKKLKKELEDLDDDEGEVSDEDEAADMDPAAIKRAGVELEEAKPEVGGV